jgi:hypothetical protein
MEIELIMFLFMICVILVALFLIGWLFIELYFLSFRLSKHPVLIDLIETKLKMICEREGIHVYNISYEELNKNEDQKVLGKYCYTLDTEYQKLIDEYVKTCNKLNKLINCDSYDDDIKKYFLPKILLCKEYQVRIFGLSSFYCTYLHELGHHLAIKKMRNQHNEIDADKYAHQIILNEFPLFFQLIYEFRFQLKDAELSFIKKLQALLQFIMYMIKNKLKGY